VLSCGAVGYSTRGATLYAVAFQIEAARQVGLSSSYTVSQRSVVVCRLANPPAILHLYDATPYDLTGRLAIRFYAPPVAVLLNPLAVEASASLRVCA
jgi:hypothetical protein